MKIFYKTQEKIRGKMAFNEFQILKLEVIHMKKETRTVVYDDELRLEAYRFEGCLQSHPSSGRCSRDTHRISGYL